MVEYGLTPLQAVRVGTMNGAKVLGTEDQVGQIKEGLCADILIVDGDASEEIGALENVNTVYLDGDIVYRRQKVNET